MSRSLHKCLHVGLMLSGMALGMAGGAIAQTQPGYSPVLDFNGDGLADIVDHHAATGQFWIRLNLGNGTFAPAGSNWGGGTTAAPGGTWRILTGDFDGAVPGFTDFMDWHVASGSAWTHTNQHTGTFNPTGQSFPPSGGTMPTNANVEVLVSPIWAGYSNLIEHNRATGSLAIRFGTGYLPPSPASYVTQTGSDWRIAVCNFDGNNYSDLIEYHIPSAQFWVHLSNVNGTDFNPAASIAWTAFSHPSFTTIFGDYNGDNLCDYADLNKVTGEFWVHLNQGNGTFNAGNYAYGVYANSAGMGILGLPITF